MALTIEASELMEYFLWCNSSDSNKVFDENEKKIENEVADIAILLFEFCNMAKIDLTNAVLYKLEINKAKYPVNLCKGRANKYNNLGDNDA